MQNRFERFTHAIFEISRYWHKITAAELEHLGLKGTYAIYLTVLSRFPEGLTAAKLCERAGRDKADVSRALADFEQKGLIDRQNGYRSLVVLTEAGRHAAEFVRSRAELAVTVASEGVSAEMRTAMYEALGRIAENLQAISRDGLPHPNDNELIFK